MATEANGDGDGGGSDPRILYEKCPHCPDPGVGCHHCRHAGYLPVKFTAQDLANMAAEYFCAVGALGRVAALPAEPGGGRAAQAIAVEALRSIGFGDGGSVEAVRAATARRREADGGGL